MSKIDAETLYKQFKRGERKYNEEIHCPMIIDVMNRCGTMAAFCKQAQISDRLFYKWTYENPIFKECYEYGKMLSKANWEEEGERGKEDQFFNFDQWRITGAMRYNVGKNKIRMGVNPKETPYIQYQQLIEMANGEEFNASEIKQLMESLNTGSRVYDSFQMQKEVDKIREDLARMSAHNANNSSTIEKVTKTD